MSENKFTPGPYEWSRIPSTLSNIFKAGDYSITPQPGQTGPVAIVAGEANAALFTAAPDLLEALENLISHLAANCEDGMTEHAKEMIAARAAIAKAKGGE